MAGLPCRRVIRLAPLGGNPLPVRSERNPRLVNVRRAYEMRRVEGGFARGAARRLESILPGWLDGWPALAGLSLHAAGPIEVFLSRR